MASETLGVLFVNLAPSSGHNVRAPENGEKDGILDSLQEDVTTTTNLLLHQEHLLVLCIHLLVVDQLEQNTSTPRMYPC